MTSRTDTDVNSFTHPDQDERVKPLLAAMAARAGTLEELRMQEASFAALTDPNLSAARSGSATPSSYFEAVAELPTVRVARARAEVELAQLERDVTAARQVARQELRERFAAQKRQHVARIAETLRAARVHVDALARLEDAEQSLLPAGWCGADRVSSAWAVIMSSTPSFESLLDHWLGAMRQHGLLDG